MTITCLKTLPLIMMLVSSLRALPLPKRFGRLPSGARLLAIQKSPHYRNGQFQNLEPTPMFVDSPQVTTGEHFSLLRRRNRPAPPILIPAIKTDLRTLPDAKDLLVWFGHSSYFLQIDGKRFLVDPVFSAYAAPFSGMVKAYSGTTIYHPADLPEIDFLIITHDHWDHLDYQTVTQLEPKVKMVICPLGVGAHLEYWGYPANKLIELDWYEKAELGDGFTVHSMPARHFSGRWLKRNQTLWSAFVLETPHKRLFLGGDGGYGSHFKAIGQAFGEFDLAILECGQYNFRWRYVHAMPEEVLQAARDLHARHVLPVHNSRFTISTHAWDEPLSKITELNRTYQIHLLTPLIGEPVELLDSSRKCPEWWRNDREGL